MLRTTLINTIKPQLRNHSTTATVKRTFPSLSSITPTELGQQTTPETTKFGHGTYFLARSNKGNLPIYINYKANNVPYTEVRKVSGDIVQLRNDLQGILSDVSKDNFKIRMESMKLLIKGNHKQRLVDVLEHVF